MVREAQKPNRARRPGRRGLLLWSTGVVLLLFALEGALRIKTRWFPGDTLPRLVETFQPIIEARSARFTPAPYLNYQLNPDFIKIYPGVGVTKHNAQGFRAISPIDPVSTSGTLRIVCLGGSTTYGVGVADNRDTYPAQLERIMQRAMPTASWREVEAINLGVGGYTTAEILANLQYKALRLSPQIAIVQEAINDVIPRFYDEFDCDYAMFRRPMETFEPGWIERSLYRSHLFLLIASGLGWITPPTLQAQTQHPMPPIPQALKNLRNNGSHCFEANLKSMVAIAEQRQIQLWLMTQAYLERPIENESLALLESGYQDGLAEHNEVIRRVARESGVGLIDLAEMMPLGTMYFHDQIHMTQSGNKRKAELIAEALLGNLPKMGQPGNN